MWHQIFFNRHIKYKKTLNKKSFFKQEEQSNKFSIVTEDHYENNIDNG